MLLKQNFARRAAGSEIHVGNGAVGKAENQAAATVRVEGFGKPPVGQMILLGNPIALYPGAQELMGQITLEAQVCQFLWSLCLDGAGLVHIIVTFTLSTKFNSHR
jgi:hypothetical protein